MLLYCRSAILESRAHVLLWLVILVIFNISVIPQSLKGTFLPRWHLSMCCVLYAVAHLCRTLQDPRDYKPTRPLCPGGFSRQEHWSGLPCLLQGIFPTQGLNPGLLPCRWILDYLSHWGSQFKIRRETHTKTILLWSCQILLKLWSLFAETTSGRAHHIFLP